MMNFKNISKLNLTFRLVVTANIIFSAIWIVSGVISISRGHEEILISIFLIAIGASIFVGTMRLNVPSLQITFLCYLLVAFALAIDIWAPPAEPSWGLVPFVAILFSCITLSLAVGSLLLARHILKERKAQP